MIAVAVFGLVAAALGAGCASHHRNAAHATTTIPAHVQLSGSLQLVDNAATYQFGNPCTGRGSASDVRAGAPVVVRDAHNIVLGQGTLQAGHADSNVECVFPFVVNNIPLVPSYRIGLGRYGDLGVSQDQLATARWNIHLGLATTGVNAGHLEAQQ